MGRANSGYPRQGVRPDRPCALVVGCSLMTRSGGCLPDQAVRQVKCDADGQFYVDSDEGEYHLFGDDGRIVVGVYPMNNKEPIIRLERKD
jgi:hypothetical protein